MKFEYKPRRNTLTTEQKAAVCKAYIDGASTKTISEDFDISVSQVYVILRAFDGKEI